MPKLFLIFLLRYIGDLVSYFTGKVIITLRITVNSFYPPSGEMAEVGTALAVVGLAGQILEGVQYLHSFFSNVKNAPEFVGSLDRELVCIQDILKNIRDRSINPSPGSQNDPLESALKNCAEPITLLQDLIKENDLQGPERGLRRQWNQICTGFKRKDFARYIDQLERAKTNLLNANVLKIR